ncbi:MAG: DUF2828 family protein [Bacillota bacterium]|nr:DUF2828 family protein [Bacillota bacterium]
MLEWIKDEANLSFTENGAVTRLTTGSDCLDLFATIGALRHASESEIILRFIRAFGENPNLAMKLLFYARDIRGGLGERRVFRILLSWLAQNEPAAALKNLRYVADFGRYDDLLVLLDTPLEEAMLELLKRQFEEDLKALRSGAAVSLLAKWLPSINASSQKTIRQAKRVAGAFGCNAAAYRKALAALRARIELTENHLRLRSYDFDYEKQPAKAMFKYRKALARNDGERYRSFLAGVRAGRARLHTATLAPYELVSSCLTGLWGSDSCLRPLTEAEIESLNTTWAALPSYGNGENALAVVDTSGSMYWDSRPAPAAVALSLGLYFAEHNTGAFRNHFIEFSERPQLIEIKGESFYERLRYVTSFSEVANTNLEAVFDLLLRAALRGRASQSELPTRLVIISDMEFDACVDNGAASNFENARAKFAACGYRLPDVIFWNVSSRNRQQPVTRNEAGVALVSGVSPRLFEMIASGELSPWRIMMDLLMSERYAMIAA